MNNVSKYNISSQKVAELGMALALVILLNFISSFYLARFFVDGWSLNISFFIIALLVYRYHIWWAATINLIGLFFTSLLVNPGQMFPVLAGNRFYNITMSLLLDYFATGLLAPVLAFYILKLFNYETKGWLLIMVYFVFAFIFTFISGVIIWGSYANSWGKYIYSLVFNLTSALGSAVVALILFLALVKVRPTWFKKGSSMNFQMLIQKYHKGWIAYTEHQFVKQIANGRLSSAQFAEYLKQDTFYLAAYAKCWKQLATLTADQAMQQYCLVNAQDIIQEELKLRQELKLDLATFKISRASRRYIEFMSKVAKRGNFDALFFALLGCFTGYAYMGKYLKTHTTSQRYAKWIKVYTDPVFMQANDDIEQKADQILATASPKTIQKVERIFKKTLILEKNFFGQVL